METQNDSTGLRPWVFILFLFFGPTIGALAENGYMYSLAQVMVDTQAIITQLVFEHAMRIRMKAETDESDESASAESVNGSRNVSGAATPVQGDEEEEESSETLRASEAATIVAQASESSTTPTVVATNNKKGKSPPSSSPPPPSTTSAKSKKSSNLIGRINNLVTSDLEQITSACDLLGLFLDAPLQIAFSIVFLYGVLGWSAFVGLGAIVLMLPVPTVLGKVSRNVQKMRSEKMDVRVGFVTEGWESAADFLIPHLLAD